MDKIKVTAHSCERAYDRNIDIADAYAQALHKAFVGYLEAISDYMAFVREETKRIKEIADGRDD